MRTKTKVIDWDESPDGADERLKKNLWALVESTFLPADFMCLTHKAWTSNKVCDESCETVGVYYASSGADRPSLWSDMPVGMEGF